MRDRRVAAPSRFGPPIGADTAGAGGRRWVRSDLGLGGAYSAPGAIYQRVGGPGDLGSMFASAWSGFLNQGLNAAEIALGTALLLAALAIVISQTSAGRAAGAAGGGAVRRGARFIPGVGALA